MRNDWSGMTFPHPPRRLPVVGDLLGIDPQVMFSDGHDVPEFVGLRDPKRCGKLGQARGVGDVQSHHIDDHLVASWR